MHYLILLILILLGIWFLFWLIQFLFTGLVTTIAVIGAALIVALDYLARPLTWIGLSSPEIGWAVVGGLVCGSLGVLISARSVTTVNEFRKVFYGTLIGLGVFLSAVLLTYATQSKLDLVGSWDGNVSIDSKTLPAMLTIERKAEEALFGNLHVAVEGSAGYRIEVIGYLIPGTNKIFLEEQRLLATPKNQQWILSQSQGSIALGARSIYGGGEKIGEDGRSSKNYSWSFSRK